MTKLTIKEEMRAIDSKDRAWYDSLTDEERKKLGIWVLMRYTSNCKHDVKDIEEYYLEMTNDFVNVNFNTLAKHPQLQFQLLQLCGIGKAQFHPWIAPGKKGTESKLYKIFREQHPQLNDDEIEIIVSQYTEEEAVDMLDQLGYTKAEIKKILK